VQRDDDTPETILKRLETYKKETEPLQTFFRYATVLHNSLLRWIQLLSVILDIDAIHHNHTVSLIGPNINFQKLLWRGFEPTCASAKGKV